MEFSLDQIAALLGGSVEGNGNLKVSRLDKIQEGKPGGISFLANEKYEAHIYSTEATAVIVGENFEPQKPIQAALIKVKNPYTGFTQLLEAYVQLSKGSKSGVEEPAYVGEGTEIGPECYRGAFSYIGKNSRIGKAVKIHPQAYIGDGVTIGDYTIIHTGARICDGTSIGQHCELKPNCVIGSDGFGFAPQDDGTYKTIPQIGNVIIEDYVHIGANTTIDCATMGSTLIKRGAKIDNLVQIAHNVVIGSNTVIAAQAGISGSTEIGANCVIAGKAGIVGHIKIADRTTIGANTGVSKSIITSGQTLFGYMGFELKAFLKSYSIFKNLSQLQDRIKELEKKQ
jgi:UDP-3-O-[3-hydroxymyristoyl] glucosamine N-acyltransferase